MANRCNHPTLGTLQLILLLCLPAQAQDTAGNAENGKQLYLDFACYSCHGYNATGRTPLDAATSGILSSETLFLRYLRLRADQNPVNPKNTMPNYSANTLSDDEARDIYAYLVSLHDEPPALEDIEVMQQIIEWAGKSSDVDDVE